MTVVRALKIQGMQAEAIVSLISSKVLRFVGPIRSCCVRSMVQCTCQGM